jgi:hypothetical protein
MNHTHQELTNTSTQENSEARSSSVWDQVKSETEVLVKPATIGKHGVGIPAVAAALEAMRSGRVSTPVTVSESENTTPSNATIVAA